MPAINIKQMKITEPSRNFDATVNAETNIPAEDSTGLSGGFKFFMGIKAFFKGISALGTLTTTSRIPVTDSNGNVTYTTPTAIKNALSLVNKSEGVVCKKYNSPGGSPKYITITCNETFGGLLLSFSYSAQYLIDISGVTNLNETDYGFFGYAVSEDKTKIYLKVTAYRKYSIINLGGNDNITISDASTTAPEGVTFSTTVNKYARAKLTDVTGTVDTNGSINLPIRLPNRVVAVYGNNKLYIPFVYTDYWVCYCMNVGGTKVTNGTELTLTVVYV